MKYYLFSILTIYNLSGFAQSSLPDNFKIGKTFEIFSEDSIKIYFNCGGTPIDKKCASYYRIGKMNPQIINVEGEFYDYDIRNKLFFKATMFNNNLEGPAYYYYKNGKVREEGHYQNNARQGKWIFYYPNGKIKKIYEYSNGDPTVLEAYASNGKARVVNGTGNFKTEFSYVGACNKFIASGLILNGKKNGNWTFTNPKASSPIANEIYEEGIFVKGKTNNYEYTQDPRIILTNFYPNEHLSLLENGPCLRGMSSPWKYGNDYIQNLFFPELQSKLLMFNELVANQWLAVGITVSRKNKLKAVSVASSVNDIKLEKFVYQLVSQMTNWQTAVINSGKIESNIFFTILVDNNQIIIPADYILRDVIN